MGGLDAVAISMSQDPIACVITPHNQMEFHKIRIIHGNFFILKKWGVFMVDPGKSIPAKKTPLYFYDARNANPLNLLVLDEIEKFAKDNKLHKIRRSDVRHGGFLRKLHKENKEEAKITRIIQRKSEDEIKAIRDTVAETNENIENDNESRKKQGQEPINYSIEDYTSHIVNLLLEKELLDEQEGEQLKLQLIEGTITFDNLIDKLAEYKQVNVQTPLSMNAERFFEDFHTFSPSSVNSLLDRAERLGKRIDSLSSPMLKNTTSLWVVLAIIMCLGGLGAFLWFSDFNIGSLRSLVPF